MAKAARLVLFLVLALSWGPAAADRVVYQLEVEGMVCAYCAYNLSRHLGELPGVSQEGVEIDLAGGTARFAGHRPLSREAVASAVKSAGFTLTGMRQTGKSAAPAAAQRGDGVLRLELDREALGAGYGDALLEALGSALVRHGGRLEVIAPEALETGILKPLLMGRKTAVPVHFEPGEAADGDITLQWFRAPVKN